MISNMCEIQRQISFGKSTGNALPGRPVFALDT